MTARTIGWQGTIALPPGGLTTDDAMAVTTRVAGAYELSPDNVVIEPTKDRRGNHARIMVFTDNPLHSTQTWPGPGLFDAESGVARVGVYVDGDQVGYRWYRRGSGAVQSLISGSTDSGKSRFVDQLLCIERHSGLIVTWVIDPQRGQSLPDWPGNVDWFARDVDEGLDMLRAAENVMLARNHQLARMKWTDEKGRPRRGKAFFDPTPEMPLLSITIEEAHVVLANQEAAEIVERIVNQSRKCGIKVRLVTQVPLLSQLGNRMPIRDAVASGNVVVFRTSNSFSGQVAFNGALPVDPVKLPRETPTGDTTAGLGFALGPSARPAPIRTYLVGDPYDWATSGTPATLDQVSVQAAGDDYAAAQQRSALDDDDVQTALIDDLNELASDIAKLPGGDDVDPDALSALHTRYTELQEAATELDGTVDATHDALQLVSTQLGALLTGGTLDDAAGAETAAVDEETEETTTAVDVPQPATPTPLTRGAPPTPLVGRRSTVKARIVEYLDHRAGDHVTTGVIAQALDVPVPTVSKTLSRLAAASQVTPIRRGEWTAADNSPSIERTA